MRPALLAFATSLAAAAPAQGAAADAAATYLERTLHVSRYQRAEADLNGDGRPEVFAYATDENFCGSGGCLLYVLSPQAAGYRVVMRATVSRLPINLLPTSTRGWRDIGVTVAGGGIGRSYMARMRYNGGRYPGNPTVPPAVPLKSPAGQALIAE